MEDQLITMFKRIIQQEPDFLKILSVSQDVGLTYRDDTCHFSIAGLYRFLCNDEGITYKEFRAELYRSRLNQALVKSGHRIDIHHSTGNVDTSIYKLIKL